MFRETKIFRGSKMSNRTTFMVIMIAIIFSFIITRVKGNDKNENNINERFVCEKVITAVDESGEYPTEARVKMLKKCNPNYTQNDTIKKKCEEWPTYEDQLRNHFLTFPILSNETKIIYWNVYCAWCNFDHNLRSDAMPLLYFASIDQCGLSGVNNFEYVYNESDITQYLNALCYGNTPRFISEQILIDDDYCNDTLNSSEDHDPVHQTSGNYCSINLSIACPELPFRNDLVCTYGADHSKHCAYNYFLFEVKNVTYGVNSAVNTPKLKIKFFHNEYSNQTKTNSKKTLTNTNPLKTITNSSYKVSIIFLILCVVINTNTKSLTNLPNRTLYSFCIAQLIYSFVYLNYKSPFSEAKSLMVLFGSLSSILWSTVVTFEYSRLMYCLVQNQRIPTEIQMKKYMVYCLVCWILPTFAYISHFLLYCISTPNDNLLIVSCEYNKDPHKEYSYTRLTKISGKIISICRVIIALGSLASTFAIAYMQRQNTIRSNCKRNYLLIYVKMMLAMSAHLTLKLLNRYILPTPSQVLTHIAEIFDGCLGIFIFFAFYYKKTMLNNMLLMMCKPEKPLAPENVEMKEQ